MKEDKKTCKNCGTAERVKALGDHPDVLSVMKAAPDCRNCSHNAIVSSMPDFFSSIFGEVKDNWTPMGKH